MTDIQKQLVEALYREYEDPDGKTQDAFRAGFLAADRQQEARLSDFKILTLTTAYEQGVGKGRDGYRMDQNPYSKDCDEWSAWEFGRSEGVEQAARMKQEARKPLTDEQIVDYLKFAGVEFQRFWGGIYRNKDCWSTAGSQDVRKIAAGVRLVLAAHGIKGE